MSTTPDAVETHPAGYAWSQRLDILEVLDRMEGGAVYSAEGEDSFWIVTDEGTLADFLPPDDPTRDELISLARFDDRSRWRAAVEAVEEKAAARLARSSGDYDEERRRWQETLEQRRRKP